MGRVSINSNLKAAGLDFRNRYRNDARSLSRELNKAGNHATGNRPRVAVEESPAIRFTAWALHSKPEADEPSRE